MGACACGDTSCSLTCAATSPSALALPVASCVNSNCQSLEAKDEAIDSSTFACPSACTCSLDKCSSQISACLADANCAASQACAAACACGDTSCSLTCAATSPSVLALPVASCVNSNCQSLAVSV